MMALVLLVAAAPAWAQPDLTPRPPQLTPPDQLGPALWRGARIGMSRTDVTALFPAVTPSKGESLPNGSKSAFNLTTELGGAPATAQFYFNPDGLSAVIIDRPDVAPHATQQNLVKAHQVVDQLTAEYGPPKTCAERSRLAALTCDWTLGEAKAVASYRDIGGASPTLSVTYRKLKTVKPWAPGPVRKLKPR
jgi:hypothetical protein